MAVGNDHRDSPHVDHSNLPTATKVGWLVCNDRRRAIRTQRPARKRQGVPFSSPARAGRGQRTAKMSATPNRAGARAPRRIEIYDTTLRDGTQGEGFNLSLQDKLLIARKLDELGVDYIEGGFPLSNPKDQAFFQEIRGHKLHHAQVAAFGMTRRRGVRADADDGLRALLDAQTPVVTLVGKSSEFHATKVLNVTKDENLKMIGESVGFIRAAGRK